MVCFRYYDIVVITEMQNNVNATAIAIAFAAGGACKAVQTTPLLSTAEAVDAMKKVTVPATVLQAAHPCELRRYLFQWASITRLPSLSTQTGMSSQKSNYGASPNWAMNI
jgi:lipocalin